MSEYINEVFSTISNELVANAEKQDALNSAIVGDAFYGHRGVDQKRIAREGVAWVALLLRKNADYDSSAWKRPVLAPECDVDTAMRVRMSDKIERIMSLLKKDGPEVAEESIRDTMRDLGAYCLLWLACPNDVVSEVKQ
jgi:hypothetical protein